MEGDNGGMRLKKNEVQILCDIKIPMPRCILFAIWFIGVDSSIQRLGNCRTVSAFRSCLRMVLPFVLFPQKYMT